MRSNFRILLGVRRRIRHRRIHGVRLRTHRVRLRTRRVRRPVTYTIVNSQDRFSRLPDEVIYMIFSNLDTKYAVATCVASRGLRRLLRSLPDLVLDDRLTRWLVPYGFSMFVLRLLRCRNTSKLSRFELTCRLDFNDNVIQRIIRLVAGQEVQEMSLIFHAPAGPGSLPIEVFLSKSLVVLKLEGTCIIVNIPSNVCLVNLKVLSLEEIDLRSPDEITRVLDTCSKLEDLVLRNVHGLPDVLRISSDSLFKLAIIPEKQPIIPDKKIFINTPNLNVLDLGGPYPVVLSSQITSLDRASLGFEFVADEESLAQLIKGLKGLTSLFLSRDALLALQPLDTSPLTALDALSTLEIDAARLDMVLVILQIIPRLEVLVIQSYLDHHYGTMDIGDMPTPPYRLPAVVPSCLSKRLTSVEFKLFMGDGWDFELVRYLLAEGKVLTSLKISTTNTYWKKRVRDFRKRIKCLPCPQNCQVKFDRPKED